MAGQTLQIVWKVESVRPEILVDIIGKTLAKFSVATSGFFLYEDEGTLSEFVDKFKRSKTAVFNIRGHGFEFRFSRVPNHGIEFIRVSQSESDTISFDEWVTNLWGIGVPVMGWVFDDEYNYWQNATDPLQFTAKGKSYAGLPMKSNGLPPPLKKDVIDTSKNPGRYVLRNGCVEAIGSRMWIADAFWQSAGTDRNRVESAKIFSVRPFELGGLEIQAAEACFKNSGGEDGRWQNELRELLFPQSNA